MLLISLAGHPAGSGEIESLLLILGPCSVGGFAVRFVLAVVLILSIPMAAMAERYQTTWFVLANGDLAIPSSPGSFNNHWNQGFGGGLGAGLQVTP